MASPNSTNVSLSKRQEMVKVREAWCAAVRGVTKIQTGLNNICREVMGPDAMILVFCMLSFKSAFSFSSFTLIKRLLSSSSLSAMGGVICTSVVIDISPSNLSFSLIFIQPGLLHDVFCIKVK